MSLFLVEFIALLARERFTIWEWRMLGITLSRFRRENMIRTTTDEFGQQYPQLAGAVWRSLNPLLYFALPIMVGLYGVIVAVFWSSIPNWLKF